jgi:hypothetical protein
MLREATERCFRVRFPELPRSGFALFDTFAGDGTAV